MTTKTQDRLREIIKKLASMSIEEYEKQNLVAIAEECGVKLEQLQEWVARAREAKTKTPSLKWRNSTEQVAIEHRASIVDKIIYNGTSILLIGKPKSGKSTFCLDMCGLVIKGESFLKEIVTAAHILYVTEQGVASFNAQMQKSGLISEDLQGSLEEHPPKQFQYLCVEDWYGLTWPEIVKATRDHAVQIGATFCVFDTLPRLAQLTDENSAPEMTAAMSVTNSLIAAGVTVLFVMHERKSGGGIEDSGRGSNAAAGFVDVIIRLTRADAKLPFSHRSLEVMGRFEAAERIVDRKTSDSASRYTLMGDVSTVKSMTAQQVILNLFDRDGVDLTRDEIREHTQLTKSAIKRAVERLVELGNLQVVKTEKRGDPGIYRESESHKLFRTKPPC